MPRFETEFSPFRVPFRNLPSEIPLGIVSYTDGLLLNNKTGCSVHTVLGKTVIYNGNFYLGNTATVFQAEITAIRKSAQMLLRAGWKNQTITFYSNSQASLAALNKSTVNSYAVEKCLNDLNILGKENQVHLRWVKAHVGIHGNEIADFLEKKHLCKMALWINY